uniref:Nondiscriminating glutamyl-tRNA synthetase EARS2, mitochondrial n=1 Tax=Photinus pyralis TaxID=7054 RepID=A0A1Y1KQ26_PHOPY
MHFLVSKCGLLKIRNKCGIILTQLAHTGEVRVRFAPSPTGFLHLGGLRTALYNFLFAKSKRGKFILRIEDTDQTRVVDGALEQIQKDLNWAGVYIDEGPRIGGLYGPYIQSQRLSLYKDQVNTLLDNESAYRCFCTSKRLDLLRLEAARTGQIPKYDNRCRHLTKEQVQSKLNSNMPHCVRFKLTPGLQTFEDLIYGTITYDVVLNEGDPVIFKSDGFPTYHFANVVDDHFMKISHVLRGVEWQISTTKHIMMYRAFNWDPPMYGHLPLLMNSDGTKLSKRQGDIQIKYYRDNGILPQALNNLITHSGGGFDKDLERGLKPRIYTMDELADQFDLKNINSHSGKVMSERLLEFNGLELDRQIHCDADLKILVAKVQNIIREKFPDRVLDNSVKLDEQYIKSVLSWTRARINRLNDLVSNELAFLWIPPAENRAKQEHVRLIKNVIEKLEEQESLTKDSLKLLFKEICSQNNIKFSAFMQMLRSALSGLKVQLSVRLIDY